MRYEHEAFSTVAGCSIGTQSERYVTYKLLELAKRHLNGYEYVE